MRNPLVKYRHENSISTLKLASMRRTTLQAIQDYEAQLFSQMQDINNLEKILNDPSTFIYLKCIDMSITTFEKILEDIHEPLLQIEYIDNVAKVTKLNPLDFKITTILPDNISPLLWHSVNCYSIRNVLNVTVKQIANISGYNDFSAIIEMKEIINDWAKAHNIKVDHYRLMSFDTKEFLIVNAHNINNVHMVPMSAFPEQGPFENIRYAEQITLGEITSRLNSNRKTVQKLHTKLKQLIYHPRMNIDALLSNNDFNTLRKAYQVNTFDMIRVLERTLGVHINQNNRGVYQTRPLPVLDRGIEFIQFYNSEYKKLLHINIFTIGQLLSYSEEDLKVRLSTIMKNGYNPMAKDIQSNVTIWLLKHGLDPSLYPLTDSTRYHLKLAPPTETMSSSNVLRKHIYNPLMLIPERHAKLTARERILIEDVKHLSKHPLVETKIKRLMDTDNYQKILSQLNISDADFIQFAEMCLGHKLNRYLDGGIYGNDEKGRIITTDGDKQSYIYNADLLDLKLEHHYISIFKNKYNMDSLYEVLSTPLEELSEQLGHNRMLRKILTDAILKWSIENNAKYEIYPLFNQYTHLFEKATIDKLEIPINALNLEDTVRRTLTKRNTTSMYELLYMTPKELHSLRQIGPKAYNHIIGETKDWMHENNLSLSEYPLSNNL